MLCNLKHKLFGYFFLILQTISFCDIVTMKLNSMTEDGLGDGVSLECCVSSICNLNSQITNVHYWVFDQLIHCILKIPI